MKNDKPCPFCGSKQWKIETPYIDPITKEKETTYCCKEMRMNNNFIDTRYNADDANKPRIEDTWK